MIPILIAFRSHDDTSDLFLDPRDIKAICWTETTGTVIATYTGALWRVAGSVREAARRVAAARRGENLGLSGDDTDLEDA